MYTFAKYPKSSRHWAVYCPAGELVCVTVYKVGASTVTNILNKFTAQGE